MVAAKSCPTVSPSTETWILGVCLPSAPCCPVLAAALLCVCFYWEGPDTSPGVTAHLPIFRGDGILGWWNTQVGAPSEVSFMHLLFRVVFGTILGLVG